MHGSLVPCGVHANKCRTAECPQCAKFFRKDYKNSMNLFYPFFDTVCVIVVLCLSFKRLSLLSPLTTYLFFHVYSFTWRAWEIYLGAPTMYSVGYGSAFEPITREEMQRGSIYASLGLIAFAIGSYFSRVHVAKIELSGQMAPWKPMLRYHTLAVLQLSIAIGTVLFLGIRGGANLDFGAFSTYAGVSTLWPITGLIGLYFLSGRFWPIALPAIAYLSIVAVQGFHRFMLILPTICLLGVYTFHMRRKWPQFYHVVLMALLLLIFPSLKGIGRLVADGDYRSALGETKAALVGDARKSLDESAGGFLDQYAGFLTLCDNYNVWEYGKTYTFFITLPIPRAIWANKPGLADHIKERSTPTRPYGVEGKIITYLGESYVNFGVPGMLCIPILLAYVMGYFYERYLRLPADSLAALTYILFASAFIQTFRDGIVSALLFGFVYNMPIIFLWFVHVFVPNRQLALNIQAPLR